MYLVLLLLFSVIKCEEDGETVEVEKTRFNCMLDDCLRNRFIKF